MGRADAASYVPVEILEEQQVVAEMRVVLQSRILREHRAAAVFVLEKDSRQARAELLGHVVDRDEPARADRALDLEVIAVVVMELLQRFDDEEVDREPDRTAPVRVAAEQSRVGLGGQIANTQIHSVDAEEIWLPLVHLRDRSHPVL